jgi:hypothetical protein
MAVALQVADNRLDGAAAPSLAANGRGDAGFPIDIHDAPWSLTLPDPAP